MEAPPPLLDESSDEGDEGGGWIESENSDDEGGGWSESENSDEGSSTSYSGPDSESDIPGTVAWWLSQCEPETCTADGNGRVHLEEAASFVLARMKQTQSGLQAWDHADFVRMANQSVLFQPSWKPLVVLQEAQASAFTFGGGQETSLINMWHGRRPGGVVKCIRELGTLRQLRGSRLVPFRLGCNCLYDHPALTRLFKSNASDRGLPRLMHINPSMSGPVQFFTKDGVRPYCVAFAGAEFVVLDKTNIGRQEFWMVHVELREFTLDPDQHEDCGPATPGLEGLPDMHARLGTHEYVGVVAVSSEGMPTLLNGQAPTDMDRFKAWNMDERYHAVSHHVWGLDDYRIFLFLHRLLLTFAPMLMSLYQRCSMFTWIAAILATVALAVWKPTCDELMAYYFHSKIGALVVLCIQVFLFAYDGLLSAVMMASSLARGLLVQISELPHLLFPSKVPKGSNVIRLSVYKTLRFIMEGAANYYRRAIRAILDHLPPIRGVGSAVRFIDATLGLLLNFVMMVLIAFISVYSWWYTAKPEPLFSSMGVKYEALVNLTDAKSKSALLSLVRTMVFGVRGDTDVATDRQERAIAQGACRCTGGRRLSPHACSAALAIAAVRQKRVASSKEKSEVKGILVKSGMIRDSLVRTARVMLAANPVKAVEEVAHELMHAAQAGLIWPDEHLICLALNTEGRNPTAENVAWHRAKWVAVAANMIVDRESSSDEQASWIEPLPRRKQQHEDINYRGCAIPPSERCVACYSNYARHGGDRSIVGASKHMKTEGRKPPGCKDVSACKLAVTKGPRPSSRPHYEMPDDACRAPPMCCLREFPECDDFPFYHCAGREPKLEPDHARRLAARLISIDETSTRLERLDKEMADAKTSQAKAKAATSAARQTPKPTPTPPTPPAQPATTVTPTQPSAAAPQQQQQQKQKRQKKNQQKRQDPTAPPQQTAKSPSPPVVASSSSETSPRAQEDGVKEAKEAKEAKEQQQRAKAEEVAASERMAAQEERKLRRVKARRERAMEAEAFKRQRLQTLAADMQDLLLETGAGPDQPGLADASTSSSKKGSKGSDKVGEGVAKFGPKDSNTVSESAAEEKKGAVEEEEEEEEEDELSLCIVCMTEKRNACLVHGKTSHQIVCLPCGGRLKAAKMGCPVCKRPIQAVIENFTS